MGYCTCHGRWQDSDGAYCQAFYDAWYARPAQPSQPLPNEDPLRVYPSGQFAALSPFTGPAGGAEPGAEAGAQRDGDSQCP
jgi:hypothetical protein